MIGWEKAKFFVIRHHTGLMVWGLAVILALTPLVMANPYNLGILNLIGLYVIVVLGLNLFIGFAGQISLGHAAFFGLGLEVRHVTLSTGQLAAAAASLGLDIFKQPAFWWCIAALVVTGALNVGVSFYLALRLALRAHNVSGVDRGRIRSAISHRLRTTPLSFFWPAKTEGNKEIIHG